MMQDLPKWAEPKVKEYKQGPLQDACESICNPTNPGNAGKECGCYAQEVPIGGGYKLSK